MTPGTWGLTLAAARVASLFTAGRPAEAAAGVRASELPGVRIAGERLSPAAGFELVAPVARVAGLEGAAPTAPVDSWGEVRVSAPGLVGFPVGVVLTAFPG